MSDEENIIEMDEDSADEGERQAGAFDQVPVALPAPEVEAAEPPQPATPEQAQPVSPSLPQTPRVSCHGMLGVYPSRT